MACRRPGATSRCSGRTARRRSRYALPLCSSAPTACVTVLTRNAVPIGWGLLHHSSRSCSCPTSGHGNACSEVSTIGQQGQSGRLNTSVVNVAATLMSA